MSSSCGEELETGPTARSGTAPVPQFLTRQRFFAWIQWQRRPLGIPRPQLSRLRPARLPRCPLQAILR
jgi:hypothetical protein